MAEIVSASVLSEVGKLIDGDNFYDYTDSGADCFIEAQFKTNYAGVLDQVKFFINQLTNNTPFVGNLKL